MKLCGWSVFHCQSWQAALDYKHINDRYMKGKEWLAGFTKEKHTMTSHSSIVLSHSLIVNMQQDMGPDGFLVSLKCKHKSLDNKAPAHKSPLVALSP